MKEVIILDNVSKVYTLYENDKKRFLSIFSKKVRHTDKEAVKNVSVIIDKGESVALFGKNGAGKSTILKMITGVAYPTSGNIIVNGRVSALLELTSGFNSDFTGRDNIYLKCNILGLKDKEIKELEQEIIEFAEINEYIDQPLRTYSSGMKARLGFAISVNAKPEILIVDETLSVGDMAFRNKCLKRVKELIEDKNVTLLFVTHSTNTAKMFCKRGLVLRNGNLICDDEISNAIKIYEDVMKK